MPTLEVESAINDALWERIEPLIPPFAASPKGGRPRRDDRACFEAIVFVLRSGCRWRDVPKHLPSDSTCWRRHQEWTEAGVRERVWQMVGAELGEADLLDTEELFADATFAAAEKGGRRSVKPR
jgi:transposase